MDAVTTEFASHVLSVAGKLGMDRAALLADLRLPPTLFEKPNVPTAAYHTIWKGISAIATPRCVAEAIASDFNAQSLGVAGRLVATSRNTQEAADTLDRYRPLIGTVVVPRIKLTERGMEATFAHPSDFAVFAARNEAGVLSTLRMVRELTSFRWRPIEVRFQHSRPADVRHYEEWFGCRPKFEQPDTAIVFPRDAWSCRLAHTNPGLAALLAGEAGTLLRAALSDGGDLAQRVRASIAEGLPRYQVTVEQIALGLGMSERTLQRELRASGTSFRQLVDETRRKTALCLLEDSRLSIALVAALLAFEKTAFYRWFGAWAHQTPLQCREHASRSRGG